MCFVGVGFGLVVGLGSARLGFGVRYRWSGVTLLLIGPFPNINRTLIPTLRTPLVYAVATFRISKISTLTQKESIKHSKRIHQTTNIRPSYISGFASKTLD